jgi:hypothetical protein
VAEGDKATVAAVFSSMAMVRKEGREGGREGGREEWRLRLRE